MSSALRQFLLASTSCQAIHAALIAQRWAEPLSTKEVRCTNIQEINIREIDVDHLHHCDGGGQ
jgi:hypothetical protein